MDIKSLGFRTDIKLRILEGSECTDHGDYLVIRSPANPSYYWGNYLLLASPPKQGHAADWLSRFAAELPAARHMALGIDVTDSREVDPAEFQAAGLEFTREVVLTAAAVHQPPRPNSAAHYRPLAGPGDWHQVAGLRAACYAAEDSADDSSFLQRSLAAQRKLTENGHGSLAAFVATSTHLAERRERDRT